MTLCLSYVLSFVCLICTPTTKYLVVKNCKDHGRKAVPPYRLQLLVGSNMLQIIFQIIHGNYNTTLHIPAQDNKIAGFFASTASHLNKSLDCSGWIQTHNQLTLGNVHPFLGYRSSYHNVVLVLLDALKNL